MPIVPVAILICDDIDSLQQLKTNSYYYEAHEFECYFYKSDSSLDSIIREKNPQVFLTFGPDSNKFTNLLEAPYSIRRKWLHWDAFTDAYEHGNAAYFCFIDSQLNTEKNDLEPLVSVFTPAYKSGRKIDRVFNSLKNQTYKNWEWIIYDDSNDNDVTWNQLKKFEELDHRIKIFKSSKNSGIIGATKYRAACYCQGKYLVEVDHDDELAYYALDFVVRGFKQYPEGKFLYTDCSEVFEDGGCVQYGEGWGFGYGQHYNFEYNGKIYIAERTPINPKTIRHIIAAPNHIRAWDREFYHSIGGHNSGIHIADDYEIVVRSFLNTRIIHIPQVCYFQYMNSGGDNTQEPRRLEIQRAVRHISSFYDKKIHERFLELGDDDFVWNGNCADLGVPNPLETKDSALIAIF